MQPVFILNGVDYTRYVKEEGLSTTSNDIDADGSGRNILDGMMYRNRITTKLTHTVDFIRLTERIAAAILTAMDAEYVEATLLDAKARRTVTRIYYCSTINRGVPRYIDGETFYDGMSFNLIEV